MSQIYKYTLEPYKGKSTRHRCPACKHKECFSLYISEEIKEKIDSRVGRCNREIKCGYHYKPSEYFKDNPTLFNDFSDLNKGRNGSNSRYRRQEVYKASETYKVPDVPKPPKAPKPDYIPHKYLTASLSLNSNFVKFLTEYFPKEKIKKIAEDYCLGATRKQGVIFWQIDFKGKIRTGKIMQYNPETGKRIKKGGVNWVHSIIKKSTPSYANFNLCQCYFGEHLLKKYPDKPVAIVEAEKTAVIASMIYDEFVWIATGNLNGLTPAKSKVLKDRDIILYPDAGCFEKWKDKMIQLSNVMDCNTGISDLIENYATENEQEHGYDIADYIIEQLKGNGNYFVEEDLKKEERKEKREKRKKSEEKEDKKEKEERKERKDRKDKKESEVKNAFETDRRVLKRENKSLNGSFETEIDRLEGHESNLESVGVPLDEKDNNRRSNQDNSNLEHEHDPFESVNANMSGTKPMTKESKPSAEADAETREKIKMMVDKNPSLAHLIDGLGLDLV